jgi:hypothetical protein
MKTPNLIRYLAQPRVHGPQQRAGSRQTSGNQMGICQADPFAMQASSLDHPPDVAQIHRPHLRHLVQLCQRCRPVMQRAERQLRRQKRVHHHLILLQ